jgi:hypothetical protein
MSELLCLANRKSRGHKSLLPTPPGSAIPFKTMHDEGSLKTQQAGSLDEEEVTSDISSTSTSNEGKVSDMWQGRNPVLKGLTSSTDLSFTNQVTHFGRYVYHIE